MHIPLVRLQAGSLEITLTIVDPCVLDYVSRFAEVEHPNAVSNCIQVGARALISVGDRLSTTALTDALKEATANQKTLLETLSLETRENVTRTAEELPKKLDAILKLVEKDLAKTLDADSASSIVGKLQISLIGGITKEAAKFANAFDLRNPTSALSQLDSLHEKRQAKLEEQLQKIAADLQARAAASAVQRKTTGKGFCFEDLLEAYVSDESRPRRDVVTRTSKTTGLDGNNTGDLTIEIERIAAHGPGLRIAIEAKDAQSAFPALLRDVDKAMSNRGAVFGIGITTNMAIALGSSLITPVGDDKLIIRTPQVADGEFELLAVSLALEMARWKAIMGRIAPTRSMDVNRINKHVTTALAVINRFSEAKKKITSVKTALDDTATYLDAIRADVHSELKNLRTAIAEEVGDEPGFDAA